MDKYWRVLIAAVGGDLENVLDTVEEWEKDFSYLRCHPGTADPGAIPEELRDCVWVGNKLGTEMVDGEEEGSEDEESEEVGFCADRLKGLMNTEMDLLGKYKSHNRGYAGETEKLPVVESIVDDNQVPEEEWRKDPRLLYDPVAITKRHLGVTIKGDRQREPDVKLKELTSEPPWKFE